MACIFCQIVEGKIPANKVYEDSMFLAFLDISPVNPGHTLVVPKKHFDDFLHTPDDVLAGLTSLAKKIGAAAIAGLPAPGFNVSVNNGSAAGQVVDHVHFHVMPRFQGDGHSSWHGKAYAEGEAAATAEKIRTALV